MWKKGPESRLDESLKQENSAVIVIYAQILDHKSFGHIWEGLTENVLKIWWFEMDHLCGAHGRR